MTLVLPFFIIFAVLVCTSAIRTFFAMQTMAEGMLSAEELFAQELEEKISAAESDDTHAADLAPSVVPISIELGSELSEQLGFFDDDEMVQGDDNELVDIFIPQLREALFLETGVPFPGVRVQPHIIRLPRDGFAIHVKGVPAFQGEIPSGRCMAMTAPDELRRLGVSGESTEDPLSGCEVALVSETDKSVIVAAGVNVWTPAGILALHLGNILRYRAKEFIGLQEAGELLERLEKSYPTLVKEVVPKVVSLPQIVDVLRRLVEEGVPIRDMKSIVEALGENGSYELDGVVLTERVRSALARQIAHIYGGSEGGLSVVLLDPVIEDTVQSAIHNGPSGSMLCLEPEIGRAIISSVRAALEEMLEAGLRPMVLTQATVRRYIRKLIELEMPMVGVLSFDELPPDLVVQPMGQATLE